MIWPSFTAQPYLFPFLKTIDEIHRNSVFILYKNNLRITAEDSSVSLKDRRQNDAAACSSLSIEYSIRSAFRSAVQPFIQQFSRSFSRISFPLSFSRISWTSQANKFVTESGCPEYQDFQIRHRESSSTFVGLQILIFEAGGFGNPPERVVNP
jgi:hypothetical protein